MVRSSSTTRRPRWRTISACRQITHELAGPDRRTHARFPARLGAWHAVLHRADEGAARRAAAAHAGHHADPLHRQPLAGHHPGLGHGGGLRAGAADVLRTAALWR